MKKLISASAGSGKTFRLSGHFLRQLFLDHAPETILATTFTRKAAGEILGRVLTRLAAAAENSGDAEKLAEFLSLDVVNRDSAGRLLTRVTRQLHRLRVCTLDSFFQQVARSLTLELGLPPGWKIVDEHTDSELREQAIDTVLSQQIPQDAQQLMHMLARGRSRRSVRDLINETVTDYHELFQMTDEAAWHRFPDFHRLTQERRNEAIQNLSTAEFPEGARFDKARSDDLNRFLLEDWEGFLTSGIAAKVAAGELTYYRKELGEEVAAVYRPLIRHATAEVMERISLHMKAIRSLISRFDTAYTRLREEHGWLRFNDVTRKLAQSASAATGSRMNFRLDGAIRNLLLDEFQDTSGDQWKILERLTRTLLTHDDVSFFCVGDRKQAIYGWRGGVAGILDAVPLAVTGIDQESMDTSRRSSPAVIDTVNRVFSGLTAHTGLNDFEQACAKWVVHWPQHSTAYPEMPGYVCFRTSPELESDDSEERRTLWFRWVAEQIRELHRQVPGAEIGVLTRRNSTVARLVHELSLLDVAASEEGGTQPTDSPAVLALMSLLQLTSHPACRVSAFHVSHSPFASVIGLRSWNDRTQVTAVATQLRSRLMDEGYGRTLQWLSESVRGECSDRDLLRLQQVVGLGWQFDEAPSLNPSDFVNLLESSRFQKSEPSMVRVMTVHQSKGLEFDLVVLPELEGRLFQNPAAAWSGSTTGGDPDAVCVWTKKELRSLLPPALQEAFEATIERQIAETLCVFYVALTRARHSMHLFCGPVSRSKGDLPPNYAGLLMASLTNVTQALPESVLYEHGDPEWFQRIPEMRDGSRGSKRRSPSLPQRIRLAPMSDGRRRGLPRRTPSRHDQSRVFLPPIRTASTLPAATLQRRRTRGTEPSVTVDPRLRGTLMHAWFECLDWITDEKSGETGVPDADFLVQKASQQAIPEDVARALLQEFAQILRDDRIRCVFDHRTGGGAPEFQPFLSERDPETLTMQVERERTFVLIDRGEMVQGTIDRLVLLREAGRVVAADIVDFKTDRLTGDHHRWIEEKRKHYGPQLEEYRNAVSHCFQVTSDRISTRLVLVEARTVVAT